MTIRIEVTNPAEHQPSELRALALFLNNLAEDRESGRIAHVPAYRQADPLAVASHEVPSSAPLSDAPKAVSSAPGASSPAETEPSADAGDACDTSKPDVNGVMWDESIHSEKKTKNKDLSWRQKRGVDPELVKAVIAAQQQAPAVPNDEDDTPPPVIEEEEQAPAVPNETAETQPSATTEQVLPAQVIRFITDHKIPAADVTAIVEGYGLKRAADLFGKPALAGDVLAALQSMVG